MFKICLRHCLSVRRCLLSAKLWPEAETEVVSRDKLSLRTGSNGKAGLSSEYVKILSKSSYKWQPQASSSSSSPPPLRTLLILWSVDNTGH